jgi:hypothetical protein
MKREMLQKVNEAVANFRKVADQQMAEVISWVLTLRLQKEPSAKIWPFHLN